MDDSKSMQAEAKLRDSVDSVPSTPKSQEALARVPVRRAGPADAVHGQPADVAVVPLPGDREVDKLERVRALGKLDQKCVDDMVTKISKYELQTSDHELASWHGMDRVLAGIYDAVGLDDSRNVHVNGWATLSLVLGVREVTKRMTRSIDTISIVCGLLLSAALPLVCAPSAAIIAEEKLSAPKNLYVCFMAISITALFGAIIIGCLFTSTIGAAARDSDLWTVVLRHHNFPTYMYVLFLVGFVFMAGGVTAGMYPIYGTGLSVAFCVLIIATSIIVMQWINRRSLIAYSHVVHGWLASNPEDFQNALEVPMKRLQMLAAVDREFHAKARRRDSALRAPSLLCGWARDCCGGDN